MKHPRNNLNSVRCLNFSGSIKNGQQNGQQNSNNLQFKTVEEKREIVQNIMEQLYEYQLLPDEHEAINLLFKLMGVYINENKTININIKIKQLNKKIVGILPNKINERPWVNLENI
jgi:hypothetical protein